MTLRFGHTLVGFDWLSIIDRMEEAKVTWHDYYAKLPTLGLFRSGTSPARPPHRHCGAREQRPIRAPADRLKMKFVLKSLSSDAMARTLAKAERYRLLNEPLEAESICLDALEREPDKQRRY